MERASIAAQAACRRQPQKEEGDMVNGLKLYTCLAAVFLLTAGNLGCVPNVPPPCPPDISDIVEQLEEDVAANEEARQEMLEAIFDEIEDELQLEIDDAVEIYDATLQDIQEREANGDISPQAAADARADAKLVYDYAVVDAHTNADQDWDFKSAQENRAFAQDKAFLIQQANEKIAERWAACNEEKAPQESGANAAAANAATTSNVTAGPADNAVATFGEGGATSLR